VSLKSTIWQEIPCLFASSTKRVEKYEYGLCVKTAIFNPASETLNLDLSLMR
jgi:hypothetical protein